MREVTLIVATVLTILLVGIFNHGFLSAQNLRFMLLNSVVLSLVALGQTLVIATRGIDLSVAPVHGTDRGGDRAAGAVAAGCRWRVRSASRWSLGLLLGTLNGLLVATPRDPADHYHARDLQPL